MRNAIQAGRLLVFNEHNSKSRLMNVRLVISCYKQSEREERHSSQNRTAGCWYLMIGPIESYHDVF